jgi:hypothetical protein
MKDVRAIFMNEDARVVVAVVGIAADVRALVDDSTRWPSTLASRSARTLPAKPAPTTRVSKPLWPGMAPRSAESIDLLCFSKRAGSVVLY